MADSDKVVPCYDTKEIKKVHEFLYSQDLEKTRWAVDYISVWETRCQSSLPTAIKATEYIAKAIIQDMLFTTEPSLCKEEDIEQQYMIAIFRFVNLCIEVHQGKGKQPIAHIAQGLGLPTWIVDLKYKTVYSVDIALPMLRVGANACMKFLEKTFWSVETCKLKSITEEPLFTTEFNELIIHYQILQFKVFHRLNTESDDKDINCNLQGLTECIGLNRHLFIDVLIKDGHFDMTENDLKDLLTEKELSDFYGGHSNKGDIKYEVFSDKVSQPMLPVTLEKFWEPLLRILNNCEVISEFVEALLSTQAQRNHTGQRLITSWVIPMLIFAANPYNESSIIARMFREKGPLIQWERLMYAAIFNTCIYTRYILPLITHHLDLNKDFVRSMINLMAIYQGQTVFHDLIDRLLQHHTAFTLDNPKQVKKLQNKKQQSRDEEYNPWSLAPDDIDWENIPLGAILNSSKEGEPPVVERPYQMFNSKVEEYKLTLGPDKNDTKDTFNADGEVVTVEQDTFDDYEEEVERILREKKSFYKKKASSGTKLARSKK